MREMQSYPDQKDEPVALVVNYDGDQSNKEHGEQQQKKRADVRAFSIDRARRNPHNFTTNQFVTQKEIEKDKRCNHRETESAGCFPRARNVPAFETQCRENRYNQEHCEIPYDKPTEK